MRSSLSLRLLLMAALTTTMALVSTAFVLNVLFQNYFENRLQQELNTHLFSITGHVGLDEAGNVVIAPVADPRFSQPLSGYYWQIEIDDQPAQLSPSFWAVPLELPRPALPGQVQYHTVNEGQDGALSIASWHVHLTGDHGRADPTAGAETVGRHEVFISVAVDRSDIDISTAGFFRSSAIWLAAMGAFLLIGGWVQVRLGLKPLEKIRYEVARIMTSPETRLSEDYPREVRPLANEVNSLLAANEASLDRARTHSGDLAHGLKTPLTVLQGTAHQLREKGDAEAAAEIETEVNNMRHIVERELASVRNNTDRNRFSTVAPVAARLIKVLRRQPNASHLVWEEDLDPTVLAPFDEHDLTELLGNLLDNAMKWTRDRIHLTVSNERDHHVLRVEDNGPGIAPDDRDTVLERGGRVTPDRATSGPSGSGLGLTIVQDMGDGAGVTLVLKTSALGGLCVELTWPRIEI
ncbi:ATP-binding protein [Aliiroseovarius sp. KMU-50]|uniref:histidine kinase n=1 Tax=Aliiroseovarius salicola TaxID=3009082 RepID=A0ABT4W4W8_9RHOB|nr:ATP-binding protein [Aliiroseovarius sp. KMU-50]MDA5095565.1 ATP-binding protein [Aliiroseovarius sp. KMU-50]